MAETLMSDPNFWMQQKHDGKRVIVHCADAITGINRKGLTIALPQSIVKSAAEIGVPCIIDGEAVGDTFNAFDLIALNNRDCRSSPYWERHEKLFNLIGEGVGSIEFVETYIRRSEKGDAFDRFGRSGCRRVSFSKNRRATRRRELASGDLNRVRFRRDRYVHRGRVDVSQPQRRSRCSARQA